MEYIDFEDNQHTNPFDILLQASLELNFHQEDDLARKCIGITNKAQIEFALWKWGKVIVNKKRQVIGEVVVRNRDSISSPSEEHSGLDSSEEDDFEDSESTNARLQKYVNANEVIESIRASNPACTHVATNRHSLLCEPCRRLNQLIHRHRSNQKQRHKVLSPEFVSPSSSSVSYALDSPPSSPAAVVPTSGSSSPKSDRDSVESSDYEEIDSKDETSIERFPFLNRQLPLPFPPTTIFPYSSSSNMCGKRMRMEFQPNEDDDDCHQPTKFAKLYSGHLSPIGIALVPSIEF